MVIASRRITVRRGTVALAMLLGIILLLSLWHSLPHAHLSLRRKHGPHHPHSGGHGQRAEPHELYDGSLSPDDLDINWDELDLSASAVEERDLPLCPQAAVPFHPSSLSSLSEDSHSLDRSLNEIKSLVARTDGFFVRDWSLWLGWNNMKYIIETALNQAILLNRTLVLPSFVYARDCEFDHAVCSSYANRVNRRVSGSEEWSSLPAEDQEGWRIPIQTMFHLPSHHAIITVAQFLSLQGLSPLLERADGQFSPSYFSQRATPKGKLTLAYIPNEDYDPSSMIRLDRVPPPASPEEVQQRNMSLQKKLDDYRTSNHLLPWTKVRDLSHSFLPPPVPLPPGTPNTPDKVFPDPLLVAALRPYGLIPVYQFHARAVDLTKGVYQGYKAFVRREVVRGWADDFRSETVGEEVLWLQGEVHNARRSGSMFFHSVAARNGYANLVLHEMQPPPAVTLVAERLAQRMTDRVGGRMWMAGHMRRGDFVTTSWTHTPTFSDHLHRLVLSLGRGRKLLTTFAAQNWTDFRLPDAIADVPPNLEWAGAEPPREGDPVYIATDEKNATHLALLRSSGAILLGDLLLPEDRRLLGAASVLTDYVSLVEQQVQMRAAFWSGSALTSVSGTVANGRAGRGCDARTTVTDW